MHDDRKTQDTAGISQNAWGGAKGKAILAMLVGLAVFGALHFWQSASAPEIYHFKDVSGPTTKSEVIGSTSPGLAKFDRGEPNRLAVLVTDPQSDWLGLARGFKSHGIPATFTTDATKALRHQVIIAYPSISGRVIARDNLRALADHVRGGGTLLTMDLAGGGLEELFGIETQMPSRAHEVVRWNAGSTKGQTTHFSGLRAEVKIGSLAFKPSTADVIASYEDGSAAAVCRRVGGKACILGVDLGSMAQRAMNGRSEMLSPEFVNTYQPGLDVAFRWVRDLYVEGEDNPFLIGTAPVGHEASLILTHDVDFTQSVANSSAYAAAIAKRGVSATFFIQTKYVRDWNDDIFFNAANMPAIRDLSRTMEIGSHSVSHSRMFASFPLGSGDEAYPGYRPFVENQTTTHGGTLLGELRVSKFLLETLTPAKVRTFRPGYLAYPEALPEALNAAGYRYSSVTTANIAQTHLPFQLSQGRSGSSLVPVWEFPVTIEDEKAPRLGDRFEAAVSLINKIAKDGGVVVILIHPNVTDHKLRFEERIIDHFKNRLWIGSLGAFGDWWSARDQLEIDYDGAKLQVEAPAMVNAVEVMFPKQQGVRVVLNGMSGHRDVIVN